MACPLFGGMERLSQSDQVAVKCNGKWVKLPLVIGSELCEDLCGKDYMKCVKYNKLMEDVNDG